MKLNNKGFSLIEILAVVVILGIVSTIGIVSVTRLIDNSRKHYYESQQNNIVLAARAYASDHKEVLPRNIGEKKKIELKTLYDNKYIKDKIVDKNKIECYIEDKYDEEGKRIEKSSFVYIIKTSPTEYSYKGYLYCKSCGQDGNCEEEKLSNNKPVAEITFPPNADDTLFEETTTIDIKYLANGDNAKVASYSYKIYVDGKLVFNSGNKRNGKRPIVNIHEPVYKYLPGKVKVVATITNTDGDVKTYSKTKDYTDAQFPSCGMVKYDMNNADTMTSYDSKDTSQKKCGTEEFKWVNIGTPNGTRHVWVVCNDFKGIGCSQPEFSKLLETDGETDEVIIKDNNNNKQNGKEPKCLVMKCIDRTTPKITVKIKNGTTTNKTYTVEGQKKEKNYIKTDKYNVWLNKEKYPNGVTLDVIVEEPTSKIKTFKWYQNKKEQREGSEGQATEKVKEILSIKDTNYSNKNKGILNTQTQTIKDDGVRKEVFTVEDNAGNRIIYTLILKIDRTPPTKPPTINLKRWKNNNTKPTSASGLSNYSNNTWFSGKVFTQPSGSVDIPNVSGLKEYQYTTTGKTSNEKNKEAKYRNIEAEGVSHIKWRACDVAGNCSEYSSEKTIKLDRTNPSCSVNNSKKANGNGWYNSGSITATGNCSDSYSGCPVKSKKIQTVSSNTAGSTKSITFKDNAGNSTKCTSTIRYDSSNPKCNISKSNKNKPSGVKLTVNCSDNGPSGVASCTGSKSGAKTGTHSGKVIDKAGNSNNCTITVSEKKQHRYKEKKSGDCFYIDKSKCVMIASGSGSNSYCSGGKSFHTINYSPYCCPTTCTKCNSWGSWGASKPSSICDSDTRTIYY